MFVCLRTMSVRSPGTGVKRSLGKWSCELPCRSRELKLLPAEPALQTCNTVVALRKRTKTALHLEIYFHKSDLLEKDSKNNVLM